jgi:hypothetical protein
VRLLRGEEEPPSGRAREGLRRSAAGEMRAVSASCAGARRIGHGTSAGAVNHQLVRVAVRKHRVSEAPGVRDPARMESAERMISGAFSGRGRMEVPAQGRDVRDQFKAPFVMLAFNSNQPTAL